MNTTLDQEPELFVKPRAVRPLLPVDVVMDRLGLWNSDAVIAAIELGRIEWAFDISTPGSSRREVRIFHRCVELDGRAGSPLPAADGAHGVTRPTHRNNSTESHPTKLSTVLAEIIPTHWGRVRAASLQRRLWASQQLVAELIAQGCFTAITASARGADGSPEVTRESVIQFLSARKL